MRLRSLSCAAGAAAAVCLLGATPTAAAPPSSVTITANGNSTAGTLNATAVGSVQWKNLTTNLTVNCSNVNLAMNSQVGAPLSPFGFATIHPTVTSFGGSGRCDASLLPTTWTPIGTWYLNALGPSSPAHTGNPTSGQTSLIRITGIKYSVSSSSCTFDLTGANGAMTGQLDPTLTNGNPSAIGVPTATGHISSAASTLVVSNLKVTGSSCLAAGVTANGNVFSLTSNTALSVTPNFTDQHPLWLNAVV